ncbi:MAG: NADH-quinone oxidoreductase subunit C [SAR202 cluster bacterium]|nr:NADH-quinone oxidoreductase subunit C [SAR202 cluster bacterium]
MADASNSQPAVPSPKPHAAAPGHGPAAEQGTDRLSPAGKDFLAAVQEALKDFHPQPGALFDLPQVHVESKDILEVCRRAKTDAKLQMEMLSCLAAVDYKDHLQVVYFLYALSLGQTLVIKTDLPNEAPRLSTVTSLWAAADWYEREAHDLFGVVFDGHPALTPLLLYEGFEGRPGRKDFPFHDYQEF